MPTIEPIFKCPKCKKHHMCLRSKKDNNGFFFTCLGKPECIHVIWLADVIKEVRVHENECNKCRAGNKKLVIKFKSNNMLAMLNAAAINDNDRTYESCVLCDNSLRMILDISESSMRPDPNPPANRVQTNNRTGSSQNAPRTTPQNATRATPQNAQGGGSTSTYTRPPNNYSTLPNPRPNTNQNPGGNQSFGNTSNVRCSGCQQPAVK